MATPSQPQRSASQFATVEAAISHLPEEEKDRQRDAGKGSTLHLSNPKRYRKLVPHSDPYIPPTTIEVTVQEVRVEPEGSTYQVVTEDGPAHAVTGDLYITDPWNKTWIISKQTFASQGHEPIEEK